MKFFSLSLETRNLSIAAFSRYFVDAKIPKNSRTSQKKSIWVVLVQLRRAENFMLAIYLFTLFTHSSSCANPTRELVRNHRSLKCTKEPFLENALSFKVMPAESSHYIINHSGEGLLESVRENVQLPFLTESLTLFTYIHCNYLQAHQVYV